MDGEETESYSSVVAEPKIDYAVKENDPKAELRSVVERFTRKLADKDNPPEAVETYTQAATQFLKIAWECGQAYEAAEKLAKLEGKRASAAADVLVNLMKEQLGSSVKWDYSVEYQYKKFVTEATVAYKQIEYPDDRSGTYRDPFAAVTELFDDNSILVDSYKSKALWYKGLSDFYAEVVKKSPNQGGVVYLKHQEQYQANAQVFRTMEKEYRKLRHDIAYDVMYSEAETEDPAHWVMANANALRRFRFVLKRQDQALSEQSQAETMPSLISDKPPVHSTIDHKLIDEIEAGKHELSGAVRTKALVELFSLLNNIKEQPRGKWIYFYAGEDGVVTSGLLTNGVEEVITVTPNNRADYYQKVEEKTRAYSGKDSIEITALSTTTEEFAQTMLAMKRGELPNIPAEQLAQYQDIFDALQNYQVQGILAIRPVLYEKRKLSADIHRSRALNPRGDTARAYDATSVNLLYKFARQFKIPLTYIYPGDSYISTMYRDGAENNRFDVIAGSYDGVLLTTA